MSRYCRQIALPEVGEAGQRKLAEARVLVVGAGGLGCPALQYLAAAGVGTLGVVDFDTVEESNLHRQTLFGVASLGQPKAQAAVLRLRDLNPTITMKAYTYALTEANAEELIGSYDMALDATDNIDARLLIDRVTAAMDKPWVYGAIHRFEGQVSVFNYRPGPRYTDLFPVSNHRAPTCADTGVLGVLPGVVGSLQASEALKVILDIGEPLAGRMLVYHALTAQFFVFALGDTVCEWLSSAPTRAVPEIGPEEALKARDVCFIDVRERGAAPQFPLLQPLRIPLGELLERMCQIDRKKQYIVFCASGQRSRDAVELLQRRGIAHSYSLTGGAAALHRKLHDTVVA